MMPKKLLRRPLILAALVCGLGLMAAAAAVGFSGDAPDKSPPGIDYDFPDARSDLDHGEEAVRFALFGDWGMRTRGHRKVADNLAAFKKELGSRGVELTAVLLAGDNFYPSGIDNLEDPRWEELWGQRFRPLGVPFYASLGNHDYRRGQAFAQHQVAKSGTPGFENWIVRDENGPSEPGIAFDAWFSTRDLAVQVVFVDTNLLLVSGMRRLGRWAAHLEWVDRALERAPPKDKARSRIARLVVGHHPLQCFGEKEGQVEFINNPDNHVGPRGTSLTDIVRAKADAYLCGHAHMVQYLDLDAGDVMPRKGPIHGKLRRLDRFSPLQVISGTGAEARRAAYWDKSCYYTARALGFTYLVIAAKGQGLELRVHFVDGRRSEAPRVVYSLAMPLRGKAKPKRSF